MAAYVRKNIVYLLYISIQFIFCYVQMGGIYFCPFKVYQIGSHAQEGVDILSAMCIFVGLGFGSVSCFKHFFQRCLYQCQWRADIMRGIDKETGFSSDIFFCFLSAMTRKPTTDISTVSRT